MLMTTLLKSSNGITQVSVDTARNISIRLNLPLDEVLYMPAGKTVIFRRGQKPVVTDRYDIEQDPDYQKVTENYQKWV